MKAVRALVERQWSVQIGDILNYCEIGLLGYNEDGTPELVAVDAENYEIS
jgi:nitroimidazol reductase NimA-like FMN-containing flavoprotein (pyridoxamine 5'-phosphate oxidase superfamily)